MTVPADDGPSGGPSGGRPSGEASGEASSRPSGGQAASTRLLHAGSPPLRDGAGPVNVPVVRTSTVRFANMATHGDYHRRRAAGERRRRVGHILDAANLSFLPVYAVQKGFDRETAALALTAFVLGNTVLQFPIGWCADHFPKRAVMAACGILTGICSLLIPFVFGSWATADWPARRKWTTEDGKPNVRFLRRQYGNYYLSFYIWQIYIII